MAEPIYIVAASCALSAVAYAMTAALVPLVGPNLVAKGLGGVDMLKPGYMRPNKTKPSSGAPPVVLPEATGVIGASIYVLLLSFFAPLPYVSHLLLSSPTTSNSVACEHPVDHVFPHHSFATYLASLLSLLTATFLGFLDDVFDIRWRFKVPIPIIASVPLLVTYAAGQGITDVVLPKILGLRQVFGVEATNGVINLGWIYYLYMSLLSTFCTNSINILAGVNGVEVGQALVIALSIAANDLLYITFDASSIPFLGESSQGRLLSFGFARGSQELADRHLFSFYFMLPLIGVCLGLLKHNWYPAKAFIGDTFCYFSGMAFAVVGILAHFSKTLLLFFIPQIFNFLYSTPQIFGLVPCPRHRLPSFNEASGKLEPSWATFDKPPSPTIELALSLLSQLSLLRVKRSREGRIVACTNLTLLNLLLVWLGPMGEEQLASTMLAVQLGGSAVAFAVRYGGAGFFYDAARR